MSPPRMPQPPTGGSRARAPTPRLHPCGDLVDRRMTIGGRNVFVQRHERLEVGGEIIAELAADTGSSVVTEIVEKLSFQADRQTVQFQHSSIHREKRIANLRIGWSRRNLVKPRKATADLTSALIPSCRC